MANNERDILDLTSLQLKTAPTQGAKRPPALAVKTWRNKVSMTVFTNVEGLPRHGIIGINLYPQQFMMIVEGIKRIAKTPHTGQKKSQSITVFDKPGKDKKEQGKVVWGRNDEGVMYICVVSSDNQFPKIPFYFNNSSQFGFEGMSKVEESELFALACCRWWSNLLPKYLADNFIDETKDSNGGGYSNNNNSSSNTTSDDDVPF